MRQRLTGLLLLLLVGGVTLSLTHGQDPAPLPLPMILNKQPIPTLPAPMTPVPADPQAPRLIDGPPTAAVPMPAAPVIIQPALRPHTIILTSAPPVIVPSAPVPPVQSGPDFSHPPPRERKLPDQMALAAQSAADWLDGMNRTDGRFCPGMDPALWTFLEGDHYLRQAGAALALARAARYTNSERVNAHATHAILTLLDETATDDPKNPQVRSTTLPSIVINRLGAAALLVLAIHELPAPEKDLLAEAELLCNFIRKQARPDGSLSAGDLLADGQPGAEEADAVLYYPGMALCALMRSQKRSPAPWKTELVRKAVAYYHPFWSKHKTMAFVPWQTAAYTEAYLLTREKVFADCVYEMNDWLCGLQYERIDPRQRLWLGGFMSWTDDRSLQTPPRIDSAGFAESLVQASRVAREMVDLPRHKRFTEAAQAGLQFVLTLQYTVANTQHFEGSHRPQLVGGFHFSHQDGQLRIDYTQLALSALVAYLEQGVR